MFRAIRGHRRISRIRPRSRYVPRVEQLEERFLLSVNIVDGFEGVSALDAPCCIPPNPQLAVGNDFVVSAANDALRVHDRNKGADTVIRFQNLFARLPAPGYFHDDYVLYDAANGRFMVAVQGADPVQLLYDRLYIAVSDTDNPLDGFTKLLRFDLTEHGGGQEYRALNLRVGGNDDAVLVAMGMYRFIPPGGGVFDHVQTLALDRKSLLDHDPSSVTSYATDFQTPYFNTVAATMHDTGPDAPVWLVAEDHVAQDNLRLVRMTDVLTPTPTFTSYTIPVQRFDINAPNAVEPEGGVVQTCRYRMVDPAWRDGRLVAAHDSGSGNVDHLRWYDIDTTADPPALIQQGEVDPGPDVFTYCGGIDLAANGDLGLTYAQSSATEYLSMYVTGRSLADPPGTIQKPVAAGPGSVVAQSLSAGFHGGIGVDPRDDTTFWAVNVYQPRSGSWWTSVAAFGLDGQAAAPGITAVGLLAAGDVGGSVDQASPAFGRTDRTPFAARTVVGVARRTQESEMGWSRTVLARRNDFWPLARTSAEPTAASWEWE